MKIKLYFVNYDTNDGLCHNAWKFRDTNWDETLRNLICFNGGRATVLSFPGAKLLRILHVCILLIYCCDLETTCS